MKPKKRNGWHSPYRQFPKKKKKLRSLDSYVSKAKELGCLNPEKLRSFNELNRASHTHRKCVNKLSRVRLGNTYDNNAKYRDEKTGKLKPQFKLKHAHREMEIRKARKWLESKGVEVA